LLESHEHADEIRGGKGSGSDQLQTAHDALKANVQQSLEMAKDKGTMSKEEAQQLLLKMDVLKKFEQQSALSSAGAADNVGCTAVCVLVSSTHFVCANAGDSRAILCRRGLPVELSHDHKPSQEKERRRIEAAGGTIEETAVGAGPYARINYRINGNLNLSRSIGDLQYKKRKDLPQEQQIVCATPDILVEQRSKDDEFLVIACDGIWDVKTNAEVCEFVKARLGMKQPLHEICEELMDNCLAIDPKATFGLGGDNMTCMIVKVSDKLDGQEVTARETPGKAEDLAPAVEFGRQESDGRQPSGCFPFRCLRT
jgi:serine/threonine protein phosphatase PrpC